MRSLLSSLIICAAAGTMPALADALPVGAFRVAVAGTCASYYARCQERCNTAKMDANECRRIHCDNKIRICRQSGCWQQDARFGGEVVCNLSK